MKKIVLILLAFSPLFLFAQINEETPGIYEFTEVGSPAEFTGGEVALQKYIAKNTNYPKIAIENNKQGTVFVEFVIDEEGRVVQAKVIRKGKNDPSLEKEALRVVKSTSKKWIPAETKSGQKCKMRFRIPVKFRMI
ncbi:MAG: energy transducer TonB [Bacteroidia bacterium]